MGVQSQEEKGQNVSKQVQCTRKGHTAVLHLNTRLSSQEENERAKELLERACETGEFWYIPTPHDGIPWPEMVIGVRHFKGYARIEEFFREYFPALFSQGNEKDC